MGQKDAELSAILEAFSQRTRKLIEGSVRPVISNLDKKVDEIGARIVGFTDMVQTLQNQIDGMEKQADALNVKLMQNSRRVASIAKRQSLQQEQIDEITRRLDALAAEGSPAVIRRNGREAAIARDAARDSLQRHGGQIHGAGMDAWIWNYPRCCGRDGGRRRCVTSYGPLSLLQSGGG